LLFLGFPVLGKLHLGSFGVFPTWGKLHLESFGVFPCWESSIWVCLVVFTLLFPLFLFHLAKTWENGLGKARTTAVQILSYGKPEAS